MVYLIGPPVRIPVPINCRHADMVTFTLIDDPLRCTPSSVTVVLDELQFAGRQLTPTIFFWNGAASSVKFPQRLADAVSRIEEKEMADV